MRWQGTVESVSEDRGRPPELRLVLRAWYDDLYDHTQQLPAAGDIYQLPRAGDTYWLIPDDIFRRKLIGEDE